MAAPAFTASTALQSRWFTASSPTASSFTSPLSAPQRSSQLHRPRRCVVTATQATTTSTSTSSDNSNTVPQKKAAKPAKKKGSASGKVIVLGLSHHTATVDIREKLAIPEHDWQSAAGDLCELETVDEAAILSTCNRFEVYLVSDDPFAAIQQAIAHLSNRSFIPVKELRKHLFMLVEDEACWHLLRVSAGLDSLVIGEGQILSQVKKCYELATQNKQGFAGKILTRLLNCAVSAGKRVRSETGISQGAVSISSAAVELAEMKSSHFGSHLNVCIIGAGKMSRLLVQHLISKDIKNITIVNRSLERAEELIKMFQVSSDDDDTNKEDRINFKVDLISNMMTHVQRNDIIFTSTASADPILTKEVLNQSDIDQSNLNHMIIDISVPRNVSDDVNEISNINSYNVDDLKTVVAKNQAKRRRLIIAAEKVLKEEQITFNNWHNSLGCIPAISKLQQRAEQIRVDELDKVKGKLSDLSSNERKAVEALTKGIINKMLHSPMVHLRGLEDMEERTNTLRHIEALFKL